MASSRSLQIPSSNGSELPCVPFPQPAAILPHFPQHPLQCADCLFPAPLPLLPLLPPAPLLLPLRGHVSYSTLSEQGCEVGGVAGLAHLQPLGCPLTDHRAYWRSHRASPGLAETLAAVPEVVVVAWMFNCEKSWHWRVPQLRWPIGVGRQGRFLSALECRI